MNCCSGRRKRSSSRRINRGSNSRSSSGEVAVTVGSKRSSTRIVE